MAEDSGQEKTQDATDKRKEDSRKKGQIPRSRELNTFAMMLAATLGLMILGPDIAENMRSIMVRAFTPQRADFASNTGVLLHLVNALIDALMGLLPFLGLLTVIALFAPMALGGFNFSGSSLAPKAERINPLKGLKRLFSSHGLIELTKAVLKLAFISTIIGIWIYNRKADFLMLGRMSFDESMAEVGELVIETLFMVLGPLALIAIIDAPIQIFQNAKKLKMTTQEIKDEYKESEGNPEMKGKMRQQAQEMSGNRQRVPEADVIITNPTHYAVALKYDDKTMRAPIIVAKGADLLALHIRTLAQENDIPIIAAPPLARALHYSTEVDHPIPDGLYLAVAHVLSYIYQLSRLQGAARNRFKRFDDSALVIPEDLQHD